MDKRNAVWRCAHKDNSLRVHFVCFEGNDLQARRFDWFTFSFSFSWHYHLMFLTEYLAVRFLPIVSTVRYIVAWQVWNLLANDQETTQKRKYTYAQKWLACMDTLRLFVRQRIPRICVHGEIPTSSAAAKQNHRRAAAAALPLFVIMCPSQCCLSIQNLLDLFFVRLQLTEINSECTAHKRVKFLD